jgi:uncharacterized protein (TIGR03083 family)
VATLSDLDPEAPAWSFTGATTAGFWSRRQAVETTVHRWDAEHAIGATHPIGAELAADGLDEFLEVLAPFVLSGKDGIDIGGSVHVHCTDVEGEWTLRTDDGVYRIERGHAKGDVAVRGPAADLLLVVYQRLALADAPAAEAFGDVEILHRWLAISSL